jgi:hypothetical protein
MTIRKRKTWIAIAAVVLAGTSIASTAIGADTTTVTTTSTSPQGQVSQANRIAAPFSYFAGSPENAVALATALRNGTMASLTYAPTSTGTDAPPTTADITVPTKPMGWGNVSHALALAAYSLHQAGIEQPTAAQIASGARRRRRHRRERQEHHAPRRAEATRERHGLGKNRAVVWHDDGRRESGDPNIVGSGCRTGLVAGSDGHEERRDDDCFVERRHRGVGGIGFGDDGGRIDGHWHCERRSRVRTWNRDGERRSFIGRHDGGSRRIVRCRHGKWRRVFGRQRRIRQWRRSWRRQWERERQRRLKPERRRPTYTGRLSQPAFFVAHSFGITCNSRSGPTLISPVKGRL